MRPPMTPEFSDPRPSGLSLRGVPTRAVLLAAVVVLGFAVGGAVAAGSPVARHLRYFASPDRTVYCSVNSAFAFCDVGNLYGGNGFHSGDVKPSGQVSICNHPPGARYCGALGGPGIRGVLHYGQRDEIAGFLCSSAKNGITCTLTADKGRGQGFRINKRTAVRIR